MSRVNVRNGLLGLVGILLVGCSDPAEDGEPRIDLRGTQRAFDQSQERLRDALSDDRREIYDEAMRILYYRAADLRDSSVLAAEEVEALLREQIHDNTAGQIVEEALRTFREFCTDNELPESECTASIQSAGLDSWN